MPVTNIPTPGSPIRSNWAQSVSAVADAAVPKAGATMTGHLTVGASPTGTVAGAAVRTDGLVQTTMIAPTAANLPNLILSRYDTPTHDVGALFARFVRANTTIVGTISIASATTCAYNTTSDQRLKERTGDAGDALDTVAELGALVYRGRWIADQGEGEEWIFVNSQDVEPVAPFAVAGTPDGVATQADVDAGAAGEVGQIIPQQLDAGALVPLLLAAVSQLTARVVALEAR